MKFKSIFFLFNIVVILSFALIFLLPLILLSGSYSTVFWKDNWYLALIFLILIAGLDGYFIINWNLFIYLEKEDWPNLTKYLEEKIYERGRFRRQYIRLMINTALAVSNLDKIERLSREISERKPSLLPKYALLLGIPPFLRDDSAASLMHYGEYKDIKNTADRDWVKWAYAFSLIRDNNREMAEAVLLEILESKNDFVLRLLTLFSLNSIGHKSETADEELSKYQDKFSDDRKWASYCDSLRGKNIFILLLTGLLDEARSWAKTPTAA
ncbi:hypothetical protein [Spirochaeta isovalerica]|uniref:Uncharacterized protein n=1 Tax=Spirochaeta isovalerica TaxID=150 RepID=A0A841R6T7_9SPIO|nr:hypothetical protein [Spirochaeta isovalerica]MBB6478917.1 hypothetical protein [Spirochaeta isovalerica]